MKPVSPVSVVGMGGICALGSDLKSIMDSLFAGNRHLTVPERFSRPAGISYPVFEVPDNYFKTRQSGDLFSHRTYRLASEACRQSLENSGIDYNILQDLKVGICLGTNVGGSLGNTSFGNQKTKHISPPERFVSSNPTVRLMEEYNTSGPFQTIVNACSAGNDAIGTAAGWIDSGLCDMVLAGGSDELYLTTYVGFKSLFINSDQPCKPFDLHRNGLNLGEGSAMFLLASQEICDAYKLSPRGYILGYGTTSDAYHFTHPRKDGKSLKLAIQDALVQSHIVPDDISFICAHGTGTRVNDLAESRVLDEMFPGSPFFSAKGLTGHTLGAAGPLEAAITFGCLDRQEIPETIGFQTHDPELPASPTQKNMKIQGQIAVNQTLAFGGSNSVLVLGRKDLLA